jgi:hypothetical protein
MTEAEGFKEIQLHLTCIRFAQSVDSIVGEAEWVNEYIRGSAASWTTYGSIQACFDVRLQSVNDSMTRFAIEILQESKLRSQYSKGNAAVRGYTLLPVETCFTVLQSTEVLRTPEYLYEIPVTCTLLVCNRKKTISTSTTLTRYNHYSNLDSRLNVRRSRSKTESSVSKIRLSCWENHEMSKIHSTKYANLLLRAFLYA